MLSSDFAMDADAALEFVDRLVYAKTEKRLNDLERQVFLGSWHGKTYEEIYPFKAEYIEKSVGYRLWHKLSDVLGEKITKKRLKGCVERAIKQQKQIAIIYRQQTPDAQIAEILSRAVQPVGHSFLANLDTVSSTGGSWASQLEAKLICCSHFILVLSSQMAMSEMVIEILQRIWDHHVSYYSHKPWLLVLHVCTESPFPLNHDLRNYLAQARQYSWVKPNDEQRLVRDLVQIIQVGKPPIVGTAKVSSTEKTIESPSLCSADVERSESSLPAPRPVADPELPRGQVRLASAFYIERNPQDVLCYEEIFKPGALIRIKAPRQMGKTSLMARILSKAREQGYQTIPLSFQHADQEIFNSLDKVLRWLCVRVARKLNLPPRLEDFWTDTYGSKDNCTAYFEDYLLPEITTPLVLGMDEVDRVFHYANIVDDFFGLLRAWYEEAGYGMAGSSLWEKLRLVVVHSTEGYIPLDINQSPFNVGLPIELQDFNLDQVTDLACRHGLNWTAEQLEQLMTLIGGHPYLVRFAFYHIAQKRLTWNQLLESAPTESGIYGDHLRRHLWVLHRNSVLANSFSQVLVRHEPVCLESECAFKLHSLGLVKLEGNGVVPRFELYRQYFSGRLKVIV
ncbi:molecular chaperone Tir [Leptolyngbyaceae cyanobacterium CCMR0082]|uniref:Molecular chaperone Tir n=1 Tax=Adonisia turfae CCMR0082 TaxID=2304604 RepID=A0A6M0S8H6_9CYAN|nr:AAA-like domain-containing protein [Adonisia turfae]NEZ64788.1 molecular chaperone Tir [Adonisia turfae CCMR0082]